MAFRFSSALVQIEAESVDEKGVVQSRADAKQVRLFPGNLPPEVLEWFENLVKGAKNEPGPPA